MGIMQIWLLKYYVYQWYSLMNNARHVIIIANIQKANWTWLDDHVAHQLTKYYILQILT